MTSRFNDPHPVLEVSSVATEAGPGANNLMPESMPSGRERKVEPAAADVILQCAYRLVPVTGCAIALHDQSMRFLSSLSAAGMDASAALDIARTLSETAGRLRSAAPGGWTNPYGAGFASQSPDEAGRVRPGGDRKVLVITINNRNKGYWSLVFVRGASDQPFHLHEVELFKSILPMFEWLLSRQISPEIASKGSVGWQILDEMRLGVVLVGPDGRVSASNSSALKLLQTSDCLMIANGRLGMRRASDQNHLQTALREIASDSATRSRAIVAESDDGKGSVLIRLVRLGEFVRFAGGRLPSIAVFISDTALAGKYGTVQLQQMFGLSRIESEVVSLICTGLTPSEAAAKLDVTNNTVRGYLKSIFRKMGVHRQADLVRVISATP